MSEVPVEIFCFYTSSDERWQQRLGKHLSLMQRQGLITSWHHRCIPSGADKTKAIDARLNTASIILLLVSSDFFASDYSYSIEMKRALERHETGEARVIPILLRPVDWKGAPFAHLQALPTNAKPITSWTNQDDAFSDVATGIRHAIEDLTHLPMNTPSARLPSVWNVPHRRNPFFTGREELLLHLHETLRAKKTAAISQPQAISGLGGIGKTQTAIEYAYRYRNEYQLVLWVNTATYETLVDNYLSLSRIIGLPEKDSPEQARVIVAVKHWLETHANWLLILDNADDLGVLSEFLPIGDKGHILLTTRAQAVGSIAGRIDLEAMYQQEGTLLLLRRARLLTTDSPLESIAPGDLSTAKAIVEALGGLPLALDQAGAYIEETGCGLTDYLSLLQQRRRDLLARRGSLYRDHPEPVTTTWSLSFEKIKQTNPASAELLHLCAFLAPDAIPEELIREGASQLPPLLQSVAVDGLKWNLAIAELLRYSLIRRDPESQTLSLHRLVQAVLKDTMSRKAEHLWVKRAVLTVHKAFPSYIEPATWPQCQRLLAQAEACARLIDGWHLSLPEAAHLLNQTGRYLYARGLYAAAASLFEQALAIYEQQVGPNHPDTATSLNNLALLYRVQGKYVEAELLFKQALAIYEQLLGPDHPDTAASLNNLATLYYVQGKYVEAEPLFKQALAIYEQLLGPDHPNTTTSLNNLAALYQDQGRSNEAEPLLQRTLAFREQHLGTEHPDTASSLNNLAGLYQDQSNYEQAEPLYERALKIDEKMFGPEHPAVATDLNNLAELYRVQGKYEQAESLSQRALAISEQRLGPEHPNVAIGLNNLALLYQVQAKYEQAELLLRRALAIYERLLGQQHPHTLAIRKNYTLLLEIMGK